VQSCLWLRAAGHRLVEARPTSEGFDLSEFSEGGKLNKPDIALPP